VPSFGSAGVTYGKAYIRSQGLDPDKDVQWIPIGIGAQAMTAIRQNVVDAIIFWDAGIARFEVSGLRLRQLKIDEHLEHIPDISLVAKRETIRSRPQMLVGFARAVAKESILRSPIRKPRR
jgi:NitT/TauT family transport system substrate-binding protein